MTERKPTRRFKLSDASFGGSGLQVEFRDKPWDSLRDLIYQDGAIVQLDGTDRSAEKP